MKLHLYSKNIRINSCQQNVNKTLANIYSGNNGSKEGPAQKMKQHVVKKETTKKRSFKESKSDKNDLNKSSSPFSTRNEFKSGVSSVVIDSPFYLSSSLITPVLFIFSYLFTYSFLLSVCAYSVSFQSLVKELLFVVVAGRTLFLFIPTFRVRWGTVTIVLRVHRAI